MYIHVSAAGKADPHEVIGIFDMDTATVPAETKTFIRRAQNEGRLTDSADALPKSFVLTSDGRILFSQFSTGPLAGRFCRSLSQLDEQLRQQQTK